MTTEKLTYADVLNRQVIVSSIPTANMSNHIRAVIAISKVLYSDKVTEFDKSMESVAKELKKEGFDERNQAIQKMRDVEARMKWDKPTEQYKEKPELPTKEELDAADETRKTEKAYLEELAALDKEYTEARAEKMKETIEIADRRLSMAQFESLVEHITDDQDVKVNEHLTVKGRDFITIIAKEFVNTGND